MKNPNQYGVDKIKDSFKEGVSGVYDRLSSVFGWDPEVLDVLGHEREFLNTLDKESLKNLSDHTQWITALKSITPDQLTNSYQHPPRQGNAVIGPKDLLLSLPVEQREKAYLSFIDKYIPQTLQEKQGWVGRTNAERLQAMGPGGMKVATGAIEGMLGMNKDLGDRLDDKPMVDLARASLGEYYHINNPDFWDPKNPDHLKRIPLKLEKDYEHALEYEKLRGNQLSATDPANLAEEIGYSRFKGALKLGVVDHKILDDMYPIVTREKDFETRGKIADTEQQLNELTGALDAQLEKESETVRDRWNELHPGIKLAVMGAMIYGLFKSKIVRGSAMALGGVYLFQKLALGEKDPLNQWAKLLGGPVNKLQKKNKDIFGQSYTPGTIEDVAHRSNMYVRFLREFDYVNLEQQAVSLGILNDIPLSVLASHFQQGGKDRELFYLNVEGMDPLMQQAMDNHGWNADYRRFYTDPENRRQSAEAMGWVFYLYAAQNPSNADEVEFIEETRRDLPPGSSLSRLPSPWTHPDPIQDQRYASSDPVFGKKMLTAEQLYVRLVAEGREMCSGDGRTLGQFVDSQMKLPKPLSGDQGGEANRRTNEGGDANRRTNEGGEADRRVNNGGDAHRRTAGEGGEANRRTNEGGDANRRTNEGGEADRRTSEGGDAARRTAEEGEAKKRESDGGDASRRTAEGGDANKRTSDGADAASAKAAEGGDAIPAKPAEGGDTNRSDDATGGEARRRKKGD